MTRQVTPMIHVSDVRAAAEWYEAIGFRRIGENEEDGELDWVMLSFGQGRVMFSSPGRPPDAERREVDLYVETDDVEAVYRDVKGRVAIHEDLHDTFYRMREFIVRDLNGFWVTFGQAAARPDAARTESDGESRRVPVFFYGLFMDVDALASLQVRPARVRRAQLSGFALRIGQRATLVPRPGGIVHGVVMDLTHEEFHRIYSGPGLEEYVPEAVLAVTTEGAAAPALCFNVATPPAASDANAAYAAKLRALGERLGLPAEYVASIR